MNSRFRTLTVWLFLIIILFLVYQMFVSSQKNQIELEYSRFLDQVEQKNVSEVVIRGKELTGKFIQSPSGILKFTTYAPDDDELVKILREHDVLIKVEDDNENFWLTAIISWLPFVLIIAIWIFFLRQMQGGGRQALSFGKSRAKLLSNGKNKVTFQDVAGVDEAKEELQEIIEFLKEPHRFRKLGGKIPKGVLLVGPPGTGKTLLARAIAGEADVPFFSISGSDFVEMFVGVGASRVRDLFEQGKKNAPCIIFMDEIDAVGRHRGAGLGGGHDEREQTLNQLLVEMDGFESNEGVILISATNRPDVLDPALLRPGRFDRQVVVGRPDVKGREGILKVHTRKIKTSPNVDLKVLARGTPGFSGADLANLVNEAALLAARAGKEMVENQDFELAKDKVLMGVERRSLIISDKEKFSTALHEAGHTLVAKLLHDTDPVHKVTIIPRGRALGVTQQLPIDEKHTYSESYITNRITILMGGRAAEELILKSFTTGAANDIAEATDVARRMVTEWGMSPKMGPLTFGKKDEHIFLGREFAQQQDVSENTLQMIDHEVQRIVSTSYEKAYDLLKLNIDKLNLLAEKLLELEVLDGSQIDEILGFNLQADNVETRESEVGDPDVPDPVADDIDD
ncbi:ATP-dependent zinc metalloprotease FtsH [bacterium]|nr:ATP-dependent zinc metalloprotease FtsH [candidate division CSSED10-310 bacterium]